MSAPDQRAAALVPLHTAEGEGATRGGGGGTRIGCLKVRDRFYSLHVSLFQDPRQDLYLGLVASSLILCTVQAVSSTDVLGSPIKPCT